MRIRWTWLIVSLLILGGLASGCSAGESDGGLALAPESALPDFVQSAPAQVKEAYRFAIANPDVLENYPCYCGCGAMEHMDNLDCYIREIRPDGSVLFDNHAFG